MISIYMSHYISKLQEHKLSVSARPDALGTSSCEAEYYVKGRQEIDACTTCNSHTKSCSKGCAAYILYACMYVGT